MLSDITTSPVAEAPLEEALERYFGFRTFKGNQKKVINSIISGHDTLVIMPTGGGKSLCYQLPALLSEGTAIIISPLIALMKNQVDLLRSFGNDIGVAHFLNSSLTKKQADVVRKDVRSGTTKLLYLAPESLTKEDTINFLKEVRVPFVAVDEAHCISEWGHDFRPEYRQIRRVVDELGGCPVVALTASATPKVQEDIIKNLKMEDPHAFRSSFLRDNLYYEVRPKVSKTKMVSSIISYIKQAPNRSGIIYCLNRKTTEDLAEAISANGVKALPYHAGLDGKVRSKHQDAFLHEEVKVIVATIAFGMGIDKPDVRYVIHADAPKSIESYYQETGRAGRDGIVSECIMYYNQKDLDKLAKFLNDKPVAEREVGFQLLAEMALFAENAGCRRKALLHYFGESYDQTQCSHVKACDSCKFDNRVVVEASKELVKALNAIEAVPVSFPMDVHIANITGQLTKQVTNYNLQGLSSFGSGKDKDANFWKSTFREALYSNLIKKEIEEYGTLRVTEAGKAFLENPTPFKVAIDTDFEKLNVQVEDDEVGGEGADQVLLNLLKDLRKREAKKKNVPPYIVFQEPSLEEMALKYPITLEELGQITGVSQGKARKYGQPFITLIAEYVEENDIERPEDLIVKSVVNKSAQKVHIIQAVDRKLPLEDIARSRGLSMDELLAEMENIVMSGTKLNISYYLNELLDEEYQDEIFNYFRKAESPSVEVAHRELDPEAYSFEEVQMMRIKFISELAN